jgi:hypothetical protein
MALFVPSSVGDNEDKPSTWMQIGLDLLKLTESK